MYDSIRTSDKILLEIPKQSNPTTSNSSTGAPIIISQKVDSSQKDMGPLLLLDILSSDAKSRTHDWIF